MPSYRFTAYDPDVCKIMEKLKHKRGTFIEIAVREFLKTEKGKNFLLLLLEEDFFEKEERKKKKTIFDEFL